MVFWKPATKSVWNGEKKSVYLCLETAHSTAFLQKLVVSSELSFTSHFLCTNCSTGKQKLQTERLVENPLCLKIPNVPPRHKAVLDHIPKSGAEKNVPNTFWPLSYDRQPIERAVMHWANRKDLRIRYVNFMEKFRKFLRINLWSWKIFKV